MVRHGGIALIDKLPSFDIVLRGIPPEPVEHKVNHLNALLVLMTFPLADDEHIEYQKKAMELGAEIREMNKEKNK